MIDLEDLEKVCVYKWHLSSYGYAKRSGYFNGKHQNIDMSYTIFNVLPHSNLEPHHTKTRSDNRKPNLKMVTRSQHFMLESRTNKIDSSKFRGVSWLKSRKKWNVQLIKNHRKIYLGRFDDEIEAAKVYNVAALMFFLVSLLF